MYYNLWVRRVASGEEVRAYCTTDSLAIPDGHPRGWDYSAVSLGWVANPVTGRNAVNGGGLDGDVPVKDNGVGHSDEDGEYAMDAVPASGAAVLAPAPTNDLPANAGCGAAAVSSCDMGLCVASCVRSAGCRVL